MSELSAKEYKRFEDIKHNRDDGGEYWLARKQWNKMLAEAARNAGLIANEEYAGI